MRDRTVYRLALLGMLSPAATAIAIALLADVLRGGDFRADWGSGQSVLLVVGVALGLGAGLVHRKARLDHAAGRRPYGRTVVFLLAPAVLLVAVPLLVAETLARWSGDAGARPPSYRVPDPDLGFALAPHRTYRAISRPKAFDIRVRIDRQGFRRPPGERTVALETADVVVVGDSHPFGFGIAEDCTLPVVLSQRLAKAGLPARVVNAGVPGYGLGQSLLRIRGLGKLPSGGVVVVFINPINDLVNLSSMVDYHFPKPYAVLEDEALVFRPATTDWGEGPFLFSPPFASLNATFGLADQRRWYHSALVRRMTRPDDTLPVIEGATVFADESTPEAFLRAEAERMAAEPSVYASRFWPEMPQFASERQRLARLVRAVLTAMAEHCQMQQWNLVAIVAPEAYAHQSYARRYLTQVQQAAPQWPIELGWSRQTVLDALDEAGIATVAPDYAKLSDSLDGPAMDSLFLQNDDHTSAQGHALLAEATAEEIQTRGWGLTPQSASGTAEAESRPTQHSLRQKK